MQGADNLSILGLGVIQTMNPVNMQRILREIHASTEEQIQFILKYSLQYFLGGNIVTF